MTLWNKFCKADSTFDVCKSHQLRFLPICLIRKVIFPIKKPLTHFQSVSTYTFSLSLFISLSLSLAHTLSHTLSRTQSLSSYLSLTRTHNIHFFFSLSHTYTHALSHFLGSPFILSVSLNAHDTHTNVHKHTQSLILHAMNVFIS